MKRKVLKSSHSVSTETMFPPRVIKLLWRSPNKRHCVLWALLWVVHIMFCQKEFSLVHSIGTRKQAIKGKKKKKKSFWQKHVVKCSLFWEELKETIVIKTWLFWISHLEFLFKTYPLVKHVDLLQVGLTMSNKRAYRSNDFGGKKYWFTSTSSSRKSFSICTERSLSWWSFRSISSTVSSLKRMASFPEHCLLLSTQIFVSIFFLSILFSPSIVFLSRCSDSVLGNSISTWH